MNSKITLSIIINAHREGLLAYRSVRSLSRAIDYALENNADIDIEVIAVLDNSDDKTVEYFNKHLGKLNASKTSIARVDFGDPGSSRRAGTKLATGHYIGFIDADNLISENWLTDAVNFLERHRDEDIIVHPEYFVAFEAKDRIWLQTNSLSAKFNPYSMIDHNYWDAICITKSSVVQKVPYPNTKVSEGFGIEDWLWNCETLLAGIEHYVVPKTIYFYRLKGSGSMLAEYVKPGILLPPTKFLRPQFIQSYQQNRLKKVPGLAKNSASYTVKELVKKQRVRKPIRKFILRSSFLAVKYTHKVGWVVFRIHPRLRVFELQLKNASAQLLQPPRPTPPTEEELERKRKAKLSEHKWLIHEWKTMHKIEPRLFPHEFLFNNIEERQIFVRPFTYAYWKLAKKLMTASYDYVFLVPWVKKGGSDLELINYVEGILDINPKAKILVVATEIASSPWASRLPKTVKFVNIGKELLPLSMNERTKLLGTLFMQMQPKVLHLINSDVGFRTLSLYGKPLSKYIRLYILIFCLDHLRGTEQRWHYIVEYFENVSPYVSAIFADNQNVINELAEIYASSTEKLKVHYQPFSIKDKAELKPAKILKSNYTRSNPLKILWAARLDVQKRPDILMKVAAKANKLNLPVEFHVYGSTYLKSGTFGMDTIYSDLKKIPNLHYQGPFNKGVGNLPLDRYDVFLLTSWWEGLPNTLLEATAAGLPIIAPAVGGIAEVVKANSTGYLIENFEATNEYIKVIKSILKNPAESSKRVENAQELISSQHGWKNFINHLRSDYLVD